MHLLTSKLQKSYYICEIISPEEGAYGEYSLVGCDAV
jgi:hypothetical protein